LARRIGFFGGTFDPPHIGHLALAQTAFEQASLDQVLWVLTPQSPLKTTVFSTLEQRCTMVELTIKQIPYFDFSRVDIDREPPYYTVDTARYIRESFLENVSLFFIMGGDSLKNLVKWYKAKELIFERLDGLIVARRPGDELDLDALVKALPGIGGRIQFINMPALDISSFNIRTKIAQHGEINTDVIETVNAYIQEQRLYSENE